MFFTQPNGEDATCTATSIAADNPNVAWTAAHCMYIRDGADNTGTPSNVIFAPAYYNGITPFGAWLGIASITHNDWNESGDNWNADMSAVLLSPRDAGQASLRDTVGTWGYRFLGETDFADVLSYGYPENGYNRPDSDFSLGQYMMYCEGNTVDAATTLTDDRIQQDCDMGHGASGGPLAINIATSPQIIGAISHRNIYTATGEFTDIKMFSSDHGIIATALINYANDNW